MILLFILLPLTTTTVYAFAVALGLLWLSTVPPTNGIVAQMFGVRYMAMLSGITFFSHQIGSFLGAWLGGKLYDTTGSYDVVWWLAIALGVLAGLLNLPVDERAIARPLGARGFVGLPSDPRVAVSRGTARVPAAARPPRCGRRRR